LRERYFPNARVRCGRFVGTEKVEFIDQYDTEGSILEAMKEIPKFIRRNTAQGAEITQIQRQDIPEYSPLVIREILANALVHADYSIRGMHSRIMIYSDRMEIESPGMLPFGYTLEDFFSGVSHVRNKVIARVFREFRMIEEWGTGYKRIEAACLKEKYPIPVWEELGTAVRVTLKSYSRTEAKAKITYKNKLRSMNQSSAGNFQSFSKS
jgi:ATP-dependent DNA helicase RecG